MPGSTTTRGQHASCDIDTGCVAFCWTENISAPNLSYAAQYLACALPCERFTSALADIRASLGAGAVRYSFTVTDFHRLPLAGLPAHPSTPSFAGRVGSVRCGAAPFDERANTTDDGLPGRVPDKAAEREQRVATGGLGSEILKIQMIAMILKRNAIGR